MDSREAFRLMQRSMRATGEVAAGGAPDSRAFTIDGVTAVITPATPERSVMNGVVVEDFARLPAVIDEVAAAYAEAGVRAWTVWAPEYESAARELLAQAGHVLDATPAAMLLQLDELVAPAGPEPDWTEEWDMKAAGSINDAAYGDEPGLFARALGNLSSDAGYMYLARIDGKPASFVLVHDDEDNCEFWDRGHDPGGAWARPGQPAAASRARRGPRARVHHEHDPGDQDGRACLLPPRLREIRHHRDVGAPPLAVLRQLHHLVIGPAVLPREWRRIDRAGCVRHDLVALRGI
jgi:hypothetical protein